MKKHPEKKSHWTLVKTLWTAAYAWVYVADKVYNILQKWVRTPTHLKWYNKGVCVTKIAIASSVAYILWHELVVIPSLQEVQELFQDKQDMAIDIYKNPDQIEATIREKIQDFSWEDVKKAPWKLQEKLWNITLYEVTVLYLEAMVFWNLISLWNNIMKWRDRWLIALIRRTAEEKDFAKNLESSRSLFRQHKREKRERQ